MATFGIESNGMLEKTAVYYNGQQVGGIKEVFVSIDEEGGFDAFIQYEGLDKKIYTKQIFTDYFEQVKVVEPSFDDDEAEELQLFTIDSDGDLENTMVYYNDEPLEGIVSLSVHIKGTANPSGFKTLFKSKEIPDKPVFTSEITFRNEDDTLETETLF